MAIIEGLVPRKQERKSPLKAGPKFQTPDQVAGKILDDVIKENGSKDGLSVLTRGLSILIEAQSSKDAPIKGAASILARYADSLRTIGFEPNKAFIEAMTAKLEEEIFILLLLTNSLPTDLQ